MRDRLSRALEYRPLSAGPDLRAAVAAAGWRVEFIPKTCGFFFADRDNDRACVAMECFEPVSNSPWSAGIDARLHSPSAPEPPGGLRHLAQSAGTQPDPAPAVPHRTPPVGAAILGGPENTLRIGWDVA